MITVDKLIREYYRRNPDGHFFDYDTLAWFGESPSTMRVIGTKMIDEHECYVLATRQRNYPAGPRTQHYYFDVDTFEYIGAKE